MSDTPRENRPVRYDLKLIETEAGTGYFSCIPAEDTDFEAALASLRKAPNDEFMRKHLLRLISQWDTARLEKEMGRADRNDRLLMALFYDAALLFEHFKGMYRASKMPSAKSLTDYTPFVYAKSHSLSNQALHRKWIELFRRNIMEHRPLPRPERTGLPLPFSEAELSAAEAEAVSIEQVRADLMQQPLPQVPPRPAPEETSGIALEKLAQIGVISGEEMRHVSSLSPIALLREWQVDISVRNGRNQYRFAGTQTSYGRGLELEAARAAYTMEMVERCSSFASVDHQGIPGYVTAYPLTRARYSELKEGGSRALNPNRLALQVPYNDEPLHWIEGEIKTAEGYEPVLVPAQCIFLFCNLDEVRLFDGLGSTGLASGNTVEEAKVSALTEVIERDNEGVMPFSPARCFNLEARDPKIAALLSGYREQGLRIQFQDITSAMGVPCCKCFVINRQGKIIKGTGAHPDARRALVSAMTETPYPFPYGDPSGPGLERLLRVRFEDLPDYTTGNAAGDLLLLENLLMANGYEPVYVNLTREDIGLPVVRAIIPGMEITADFDRFSRVHPRLFANYLKLSAGT